ncbi:deaminase domain-containing protein [Clostridium chrysemydis]|uniref:deaminase domain-containing protein n=1 Tax=Clostridium chrysemydis TaxID=2665504 RepID=UPI001883EA92|nr:deaminase domain-containing protein [Clostridium chrysemydis]
MEKINKKRNRIKISSFEDIKKCGYTLEKFKEDFNLKEEVIKRIFSDIEKGITYKVYDIKDFLAYIDKVLIFEKEHKKLNEIFKDINKLNIKRVEFERKISKKEDVSKIINKIEFIKKSTKKMILEEDFLVIKDLEKEIDKDYIYSKDIELIKKMIPKTSLKESLYDIEKEINTVKINFSEDLNGNYIKSDLGTVEYHKSLKSDIPKIKRLIKSLDKYIIKKENYHEINQSKTLGDSINIAVAKFNDREFKAVSGKNDVESYCKVVCKEDAIFSSLKVNKLGELGIGYRRINDSEKKIFEAISKKIEEEELEDVGVIDLYSKWEPCPSCLYVISQFKEKYPKIKVNIKYQKSYGEK